MSSSDEGSDDEGNTTASYHISLSEGFSLFYNQIDNFKVDLKRRLKDLLPIQFLVDLRVPLEIFEDERTGILYEVLPLLRGNEEALAKVTLLRNMIVENWGAELRYGADFKPHITLRKLDRSLDVGEPRVAQPPHALYTVWIDDIRVSVGGSKSKPRRI